MYEEVLKAVAGALLHDIGKVVQRAGGAVAAGKYNAEGVSTAEVNEAVGAPIGAHSAINTLAGTHSAIGAEYLRTIGFDDKDILDCVMYHHGRELRNAENVSKYAYIAYYADNIAAASDRRDAPDDFAEGGWDPKAPLQSVFNVLFTESERAYYKPATLDTLEGANYPQKSPIQFDGYFYRKITDRLTDNLSAFKPNDNYINSLLELIEATMSYVPSSTSMREIADISLFDHLKLTAAIAGCLYSYLTAAGETDYRRLLFLQSEAFSDIDFAIIYSVDISGIQDFIYTIHSTGALKSLRGRSFYLELFTENLIDELLGAVGLSRVNLLYSGGGHLYMLLPNTQNVKTKLAEVISETNAWLLEYFRAALFVADGYCVCSADKLRNKQSGAYGAIYKEISRMISEKKLHRYSAQDILYLNNRHADGRECRICKAVRTFDGDECDMCAALIRLSYSVSKQYNGKSDKNRFINNAVAAVGEDTFICIGEAKVEGSVPVNANKYAFPVNKYELLNMLKSGDRLLRYYGLNVFYSGDRLSSKLWVGDYAMEKEISKYADNSGGIDRIGVLRMDVDDLGKAFTTGFEYDGGKYNTISRSAAFSRHMSLFFKRDINMLLGGSSRNVSIIYSGGDDMFLIGGWDDIIDTAIDISKALRLYTMGKLTVSAGIGIYPEKYPLHIMARETSELEDHAKSRNENGERKNAATLFTPELCFGWDELAECVVGEKFAALKSFFDEDREKGNAFLYQMLSLIRGVEEEDKSGRARISLARYAYLLARAEPEARDAESRENFRRFSERMYGWVSDPLGRKQLTAAIYLYIYSKRGEK